MAVLQSDFTPRKSVWNVARRVPFRPYLNPKSILLRSAQVRKVKSVKSDSVFSRSLIHLKATKTKLVIKAMFGVRFIIKLRILLYCFLQQSLIPSQFILFNFPSSSSSSYPGVVEFVMQYVL